MPGPRHQGWQQRVDALNLQQRDKIKTMNPFIPRGFLPIVFAALLASGCQQRDEQPPATPATEAAPDLAAPVETRNDFPTLARVEYVMQCMLERGGQNYDNLYHCVCAADTLASKLSYEEFAQAQAFTYLYNTPGERGGEFRDPPQSRELRTRLKEAKALAQATCFPDLPKKPGESK